MVLTGSTNGVRVLIKLLDHCRRLPQAVRLCAQMGAKWPFCAAEPLNVIEE